MEKVIHADKKLTFGVAGYPVAYAQTPYKKDRLKIFQWLSELGLDAFEAQMTYGPRTSHDMCRAMRKAANDCNIKVSVHAAYYIVFTSDDPVKIKQSAETLKKTYELADLMGADKIVLHPGPLYGKDETQIKQIFADNLNDFFQDFSHPDIGLFLETAGKRGQLGSADDIIDLSRHIKGCFPCFDFGHIHARGLGGLDTPESIFSLIQKMKKSGVFKSRCHFHYTPIHYGPNGEITHKMLTDRTPPDSQTDLFCQKTDSFYHPRFEPVVRGLAAEGIDATLISETHNSQEIGALEMKKEYLRIGMALQEKIRIKPN